MELSKGVDIVGIVMWLAIGVVAIIVEACTVQMVSIWFSVGSVFAIILNLVGCNIYYQIIGFFIVSLICLCVFFPILKKKLKKKIQHLNADSIIGQKTVVIAEINDLKETGIVKLKGVEWTARSISGNVIPINTVVIVREIRGVTVYVEEFPKEESKTN